MGSVDLFFKTFSIYSRTLKNFLTYNISRQKWKILFGEMGKTWRRKFFLLKNIYYDAWLAYGNNL